MFSNYDTHIIRLLAQIIMKFLVIACLFKLMYITTVVL